MRIMEPTENHQCETQSAQVRGHLWNVLHKRKTTRCLETSSEERGPCGSGLTTERRVAAQA